MIHELDKYLDVDTPLGRGTAIFIESGDNDYFWTVILHDNGAFVTYRQQQIRATRNFSMRWAMTVDDLKEAIYGNRLKSQQPQS